MPRKPPKHVEQTSIHLERAKAGDRSSLNWLVGRLSPLLLAQARYRLGTRLRRYIDPEDLVQEVWASVYPRLSDLRPREGRETPVLLRFLGTTLLNHVNNLARRHRRSGGVAANSETDVADHRNDGSHTAPGPSPVTLAAAVEERAYVLGCIEGLPETHREILILRGIEQQSIEDIALLLELEPNTVAQRWRRALEQLRHRLPGSVFMELG